MKLIPSDYVELTEAQNTWVKNNPGSVEVFHFNKEEFAFDTVALGLRGYYTCVLGSDLHLIGA